MALIFPIISLLFWSCSSNKTNPLVSNEVTSSSSNLLKDRIFPNNGFVQYTSTDTGSFAYYLQNISLKPKGSVVKLFDGSTKYNNNIYSEVIDMEIGTRDLQQCADAVMRLRAEYLFKNKLFNEIKFLFTSDNKWHSFTEYAKKDTSYKKFRKYMDYVFAYANTASLKKQLKPKPFYLMDIGDVFIQSGSPYGHAVIVMNMTKNSKGEKQFLLAQSYMPAQDIQILLNPNSQNSWYQKPNSSKLITPEWTFDSTDLRTW